MSQVLVSVEYLASYAKHGHLLEALGCQSRLIRAIVSGPHYHDARNCEFSFQST